MRTFRTRLTAAGASLLAISALAACGGGSSSPPVPAIPQSTAAPTPTPSPYPSASGETFSYSGTIAQQYTLYATPAPSPSGSATPEPTSTPWTATSTQSVKQSVVLHTNASFAGKSGLTELESNETDTGTQSLYTIDSKQYVEFAPDAGRSNGIDVTEVALDATDSDGVETTTTFGANGDVFDELPEVPASQWSGDTARTVAESDPSGESLTSTYAGDGTYTGTTTFPAGTTSTIQENADGSGAYVLPFTGAPGSEVTISPVQNGAINITFKELLQGNVSWGSVPAWYPNVPPVLASDTFADAGSVPIPSSCGVSSSIGTQATRIDERRVRLDSVFGEAEQTTQSSYVVPPYGDVCVVLHDDLLVYYDYSGQSSIIFGGTPLRHTVTDETLGMTAAPATSAQARTRNAAATRGISAFIAPQMARVQLMRAKSHLQFVRHITAAMKEVR